MDRARKRRLRPAAKSLPQALRHFLTPDVFKQVRNATSGRKKPRWDVHPLIYVVLLMTWCSGDSLPEKFEVARGFYAVCCPKRRRPGKTFGGFERALVKLPMPVLRKLATAIRARILTVFADRWTYSGFVPLGCDGSHLECPRTNELERRIGVFGNGGSAPLIRLTSVVHLTLGIPWCWRWGRGNKASERGHLLQMIPSLPALALVVTDAGFVGYDVLRTLIQSNTLFLIRMSSLATFYAEHDGPVSKFREGIAYYWPQSARDTGKPPIRGRLICIRSRRRKVDVWLFTNVEDCERLPHEIAGQFYRWRWESEGFFRTYKRTLKKLKLSSRSVRLIHREAEASMIATQLLFCHGALAMPKPQGEQPPVMCSPRLVLLEIRRAIRHGRPRADYVRRLARAPRERRERTSPKEKRQWPRRKSHKPPKPPKLLRITSDLKVEIEQHLTAA